MQASQIQGLEAHLVAVLKLISQLNGVYLVQNIAALTFQLYAEKALFFFKINVRVRTFFELNFAFRTRNLEAHVI